MAKIGCTPQTSNERGEKAEADAGVRPGVTTAGAARLAALAREVGEPRV